MASLINNHIQIGGQPDAGEDLVLSDEEESTLGTGSFVSRNVKSVDDPYDFLAQQCLDESSSDESSYWSSDGSSSDDSDEDSDDESEDGSLEHDTDDDVPSVAAKSETEVFEAKKVKRKIKRNDSTLSIDAIIKMKLSMKSRDTKVSTPSFNKEEPAVAAAPGAPRRRARRLNQDRETLGSLAQKLGSSTGNEMSSEVKDTISKLRRSESSSKLAVKPKKFMHIQQEASAQQRGTGMNVSVKPVGATGLRASTATSNVANSAAAMRRSTAKYGDHAKNHVKPRDHFTSILRQKNIIAPMVRYDQLEDFLSPITAEDKAAFDMALVGAVRDQNLDKIKELHSQGHPLQARSQFGESLLHVCARRGTPEMLRFMLQQEGVTARSCCDYGRTPLHDAAWSADAKSLEMMKILIQECPDLLLILDKRGFMPLDYIPKDRWPHCCAFLDKYKDMILPSGELYGESSSEEEDSDDDSEEEDSDDESDEE